MPIIQIDWDEIKERFGDVTALYAFTHRQASLLLSLSEQLSWEKTFRAFGYDFADKDDLDQEIDDLRNNLVSPVNLVDIIELIDEVEGLLKNIRDLSGCCGDQVDPTDGKQYTDTVVDGEGDVPQNIIDAGFATDWDDFGDYKCMIANVMVDNLKESLTQLLPYVDLTGAIIGGIATIATLFTAILASGGTALVLGMVAGVAAVATVYETVTAGGSTIVSLAIDNLDEYRTQLVCAIYNADGSEGAIVALKDAIDEHFDAATATLTKAWNIGPNMRALYGGRYNETDTAAALEAAGYDVGDYSCNCDYDLMTYDDVVIFQPDGSTRITAYDNGVWTCNSRDITGCEHSGFEAWTGLGKTVRVPVRMELLSDTASDFCGGGAHQAYRGTLDEVYVFDLTYPDAPEPSDGIIDEFHCVHDTPHTVTFRLYFPGT